MTRQEIEQALDKGQLWWRVGRIAKGTTNYWRVRRNGMTKTWKREPDRFEIPVKMGFHEGGRISNADWVARPFESSNWRSAYYIASDYNPMDVFRCTTSFEARMVIAGRAR